MSRTDLERMFINLFYLLIRSIKHYLQMKITPTLDWRGRKWASLQSVLCLGDDKMLDALLPSASGGTNEA